MQIKIKATGFKLTDSLHDLVREKLLGPVEKRLGAELSQDHILEIELSKTTEHHVLGKIWRCEANIALPRKQRTIYAAAVGESLEAAIDDTKYEIEREVGDFKNKRSSQFLRFARRMKDRVHVARLAQSASEFYRRFRRK